MRNARFLDLALIAIQVSGSTASHPQAIARHQLCVTEGEMKEIAPGKLLIEMPKTRAVMNAGSRDSARLQFKYLGPTRERAALRSGEEREQIGLKLRAQDGCNVTYAMWRIKPDAKLVVQVKYNPGKSSSAACGNSGYKTVVPSEATAVPSVVLGSVHEMRASLSGDSLTVMTDGEVVWRGSLGQEALELRGPVGFRTDNGRFEVTLSADATEHPVPCPRGGEQ